MRMSVSMRQSRTLALVQAHLLAMTFIFPGPRDNRKSL